MRDPHRFSNELDAAASERLVARLESRAKDEVFAALFDKYVSRLSLPHSAQVLELGCGTGAMARRLARREDFSGKVVGVDQSPPFLEAAARLARAEGVGGAIDFRVGDAHALDLPSASFDAAIAHTVISHVSDPAAVVREMARVVRPGGTVAIFDGDYASLTYAYPDHGLGEEMDQALVGAVFNNPRIMRDLPRLLPALGLKLTAAWGDAVVEVGSASYFKSFAETYAGSIAQAGVLPAEVVDAWMEFQQQAMENGTFFASCNYYTYLAQPA